MIHQKFNANIRTFKLLFDNLSDEIFLKLKYSVFLLMTNGTAVVLILTKYGVHENTPTPCITWFPLLGFLDYVGVGDFPDS